ncbi:MAG: twin transmembrane helix small protein [Sphingomonadales bacterium]|jgi:NADH:ubiquinone oxidoreductase subunit 6 (subunit J)|nr:twin transmembrane helix small protein [Sphingomonadales bacterium]MBK6718488.1 twin transmembrane helix small protein [Sphingomonadales bacterium]MBK8272486.1 twin transmembrane helix small protein [Sphingomonadales bacterium]MBK8862371.1 twin transmembrane helix small protein [Sphingomonadales bacterium]MBL0002401.1 twin transmembrane helix small protein [Sphingomonadales bacterium]
MPILSILLVLAIIGAVVMLVRGIIAFLRTTEADLKSDSSGPSASGLKQNKMMQGRVAFQALAIGIVVLMLALSRGG